jgi:hypothetical protein
MKSIKYTVDRFEGKTAVLLLCEDERIQIHLPREMVNMSEGDIVEVAFDELGNPETIKILVEETAAARKTADDLLKKLKER